MALVDIVLPISQVRTNTYLSDELGLTHASRRTAVSMRYTPSRPEVRTMRRWDVFLIAILVVIAILAASQVIPGLAYLLLPGVLLS
jgi:hypothetical protein